MAVSMQQFGIRVNVISPGRIKVAHESKEGEEQGEEWEATEDDKELHPTNRAGMPEDICEAAEWLLGAGFTTGQNIVIDGGVSKMKNKS